MSYLQVVLNIVVLNLQCLFKRIIVNFKSFKNFVIYIYFFFFFDNQKSYYTQKKKKSNVSTLYQTIFFFKRGIYLTI